MELYEYTDEQLQQELKHRAQLKNSKYPQPVANPDFSQVIGICKAYVGYIGKFPAGGEYDGAPDEHHWAIFEAAVAAVYGESIWGRIDELVKG